MPFILRKIRKSRWYPKDWLSENDLQSDALGDLNTKSNELSIWVIDNDKSNLDRIISALAARCDTISNFDYTLFDQEFFSKNNFKIKKTKGVSADPAANDQWHLDLFELSASKILELAKHIRDKGEKLRIQEKQIKNLISDAIKNGKISIEQLEEGIKSKISV